MQRHSGIGRIGLAAVAVALTASACARPTPPPPPPAAAAAVTCGGPTSPPAGVIATVFARTNSDRAASGLGALQWNSQLSCLASSGNAQRASTGTFVHQDLTSAIRSSTYSSFRTLGENILRGPTSMTGDQMEDAWMNSPGHRANILSGAYRHLAIATTIGVDGRIYATTIFGG